MTAFTKTDILLPRLSAEGMSKWCVVACDQYTSDPEYWEEAAKIVGNEASALNIILPEIYIGSKEEKIRTEKVNAAMNKYLSGGIFEEYKDCFILTIRTQSDGRIRAGLVGAIDLEQYDYKPHGSHQVRATEATVESRIPPRVRIRMEAPLEIPHVMMLVDDKENTVIEPLEHKKDTLEKLYDFPLMMDGGRLEGYLVKNSEADEVIKALDELYAKKFLENGGDSILFAVGDGNHSLAAAKECYEIRKREGDPAAELSRYAMVELVNLHSPAIEFEAIHRAVRPDDPKKFLDAAKERLGLILGYGEQTLDIMSGYCEAIYTITKPLANMTVGSLQIFLDEYLSEFPGSMDYIHGREEVRYLCFDSAVVGILLPAMKKEELFPTVIKDGALPRKTFSIGRACDKRFYCEARRIK